MISSNGLQSSLVDAADCCLVVIDVQSVFLDKLESSESDGLVKRLSWLASVATKMGIPSVATAEDIPKNGSIIPGLIRLLPAKTVGHNKMIFNLAMEPEILDAIAATGRHVEEDYRSR